MATGRIEFDPGNGAAQHVVVIELKDGGRVKFAYEELHRAETKLPGLVRGFTENGQ